ncbi:Rv2231c family pyridoxal phosphate-dependent protein CobC [Mobilicoccus massiliensis]|uniref:Rv2231c family pyridoxal phosphate-dependent protein CobC n=1 Tax=Mobilicoccus massiliensis TaxID=1522310 RepID=UPI0006945C54|nr:Rv2231c family pyridoxal phosphate-dependent protein CobC [Mobilicoccus massiliensis]
MIDDRLLAHHGDVEARGMLDFAVNVAVERPPEFLASAMADAITDLAAYPDAGPATALLADHLGLPTGRLLLVNGAAEAFHLIARAEPWRHPVVVHPQFTEPETALRAAGFAPGRHVLEAPAFAFDAESFEARHAEADLVFVGNPTNPTSRLHPAADLLRLRRPGRLVVVDEAFMDTVPREQDTVLRHAAAGEGVFVVRSLTKTFGLAGARAGFVVAEPAWIEACARAQPHWSVNSLALAAIEAICTRAGVAHVADVAARVAADRALLVDGLTGLGFDVVRPAAAPFVLAHHPRAAELRSRLREAGIAVRRADTFPGLDDTWLRIAVRDAATTATLLDALRTAGADHADTPETDREVR